MKYIGSITLLIGGVTKKVSLFFLTSFLLLEGGINLSSAYATDIEHVNVGRVVVDDQSSRSQRDAGKMALRQVFVKISGNTDIFSAEPVAKAIENYEQYLISSSFIQNDIALILEASFNQQKIESLLLVSGLSVWTSLRPSGILWLSVDTNARNSYILTQNSDVTLKQVISAQAFKRGVEILTPIGDLQDQMGVSTFDVSNQFVSRIQDASARYNSELLISANLQNFDAKAAIEAQALDTLIQQQLADNNESSDSKNAERSTTTSNDALNAEESEGTSQTNSNIENKSINEAPIPQDATFIIDYVITSASFEQRRGISTGKLYATSEEDAVIQLVNTYTNMLADKFSLVSAGNAQEISVFVEVANISSLEDYVTVVDLISSIPAVNSVSLLSQRADLATFEVRQNISITQLSDIMVLDARLNTRRTINQNAETVSFFWQN